MAYPVVTVEVAFTTTPFVTPAWTDVSDYVLSGSITRGRTSELDRARAGQATLVFTNEDRRFDPTHAASPYYPNVLPMRRLRVRATYNTVTYDLFSGYIDRWEQQYQHPGNATAVVSATDAFKVFAAKDLPSSAYAAEVRADGPVAWWRLGEPAGATTAFDTIGGHHLGIVGAPTLGVASLVSREPNTATQFLTTLDGAVADNTSPLASPPMTLEVVFAASVPTPVGLYLTAQSHNDPPSTVMRLGVGTTAATLEVFAAAGSVSITGTTNVVDGDAHHIAGTWAADGTVTLYVDGAADGTGNVTTNVFPPGGTSLTIGDPVGPFGSSMEGTYDEVAWYGTALSAARIAVHAAQVATPWDGDTTGQRINRVLDTVGWPAADRDIDTGDSTLGPTDLTGSLLSYLQKVEESEGGLLFVTKDGKARFRSRHNGLNLVSQATFGDGGGTELEYTDITFDYSESLVYNEIRVSRTDGVLQVAEDTTSQAAYGERTYTSDGLMGDSDTESLDRANFLLGKYKDPVFRTTRMVTQPSGGNEAGLYPQVLGRELGDKVTVRRKPQNVGATIDQAVIIQGIRHDFAALSWVTEFALAPSAASAAGGSDTEYLQLNDTDGPGLGFVALAYVMAWFLAAAAAIAAQLPGRLIT
jgi:hypothetical protein